jgi:hypothetical protein
MTGGSARNADENSRSTTAGSTLGSITPKARKSVHNIAKTVSTIDNPFLSVPFHWTRPDPVYSKTHETKRENRQTS